MHTLHFSRLLRGQGISAKAQVARNRLIRKAGVLVLAMVVCALFCVWSRVRIIQIGYELTGLQEGANELNKKVSHLELEVERLRSPGHLEKVATEILGMHPPKSEDIVFVKRGSD